MNYIFTFLILISIICAVVNNRVDIAIDEMLNGATKAVQIAFSLIGIMAFWLGVVRIAQDSGLMNLFAKIVQKPLIFLMPDLKNNPNALSNVALNVSANALGMTNAATPFGIKAMEEMQKDNCQKEVATNSMCMFLAMNTAGFQIVPAVVIAVLSANGAQNPTEIILPTLIVTTVAFISAILFAKLLETRFK